MTTATTRAVNGATVKVVREALGISQRDLAARCGVTQGHISHVERGVFQASPQLARVLAEKLGVPLEAITYPVPEGAVPVTAGAVS